MGKWTFQTIEMKVSYDGIIDPNTMNRKLEVFDDFQPAAMAFKTYIGELKNDGLIEDLMTLSELGEFAESEEEQGDVILAKKYIEAVFENNGFDNSKGCEYISEAGSNVQIFCDENGQTSISMSGGWNYQPIFKTNCAMMEEGKSYYFELEDWFDNKEHTYRIVFLDSVE